MRLGVLVMAIALVVACDDDDAAGDVGSPASTEVAPPETSSGGLCVEVLVDTPTRCPISTHCGIGLFASRVNDRWWMTDEGAGTLDYIPAAWGTYEDPPQAVTIVVRDGTDPTLTASLNGHDVVYRPIPDEEFVGCA
jgi:hypothetical protein